jgi:hypothetical protein
MDDHSLFLVNTCESLKIFSLKNFWYLSIITQFTLFLCLIVYFFERWRCLCNEQHGFARNVDWSIVDSENVEGNPVITLLLNDGPYSRSMWDFSFQALYKVSWSLPSYVNIVKLCDTDN